MGIQGNDLPLQQSREWVHARGCLAPASRRARMRARAELVDPTCFRCLLAWYSYGPSYTTYKYE